MPVYAGVVTSVPIGTITAYGTNSAPDSSWLLCDGSAVSRSTYATLFGLIGTTYGSGDGSTTFNLPDLRGRVPFGLGSHADVNALGENDGEPLSSRTPKHKHTINDPGHTHDFTARTGSGSSPLLGGNVVPGSTITTSSSTTGVTVGPQSNSPTDGPSYLVTTYMIKVL